jgi:hypothetical protein
MRSRSEPTQTRYSGSVENLRRDTGLRPVLEASNENKSRIPGFFAIVHRTHGPEARVTLKFFHTV